jgi:hypothetical protein
MDRGSDRRHVSATGMNEESSRSHAIFMITCQQKSRSDGTVKTGKIFLVDLVRSSSLMQGFAPVGFAAAAAAVEGGRAARTPQARERTGSPTLQTLQGTSLCFCPCKEGRSMGFRSCGNQTPGFPTRHPGFRERAEREAPTLSSWVAGPWCGDAFSETQLL